MSEAPPSLDLRPDHWDIVRGILRRQVPGRKVLAFGSRATWTAKEYSDLDLAVLGDKPLPLDVASALAESFVESDLPFKVDVVDWASTSESFREVIERDYVVLMDKADSKCFKRGTQCLGDVADIVMGQSPPGKTVSGLNGLALLNGPTEFGAYHPNPVQFTTDARKYAQKGDLLFCVRGSTTGRMNWADQRYAIGRGVAAIRHRHETALQPFIRAVIEFGLPELLAEATGLTFPNVSAHQLASIPYSVIDNAEQRAIAHILGTLDNKIELNRRMNETLEAIGRALFKSWFVDFEPVRAKMEGRDTGLPKHIADLFPERLVDSELGEIPEGWEISTIGAEVAVVGGSTPSTKDRSLWDGEINWATPKDLSTLSAPVLLETARQISDAGLGKIGSGLLPQGVVLLSSRAPIGYLAIAEIPVAVNQGFIAMRCESRLSNIFVWLWTQANMDTILQNANGSTFQEISKRNFRPLNIAIPKPDILSVFDKRVRLLYKRIVKNQRESCTLATLRDALLPKLVSGEIRIPRLEKVVGTVA